jgi:hypothetical protein
MHDNHRSGVTGEKLQPPLTESWVFEAVRPPEPAWPPPAKQDYYHHHHNLRETVAYDRAFGVVGAGETIFFGSSADDKVYARFTPWMRERDVRAGRFSPKAPSGWPRPWRTAKCTPVRTTATPTVSRLGTERCCGNTKRPNPTA